MNMAFCLGSEPKNNPQKEIFGFSQKLWKKVLTKGRWYDIIIKHFESGPERLTEKGFTISKIGCQPGFEIRKSGFQKPEKRFQKSA